MTFRIHSTLWAALTAVALVAPARGEDPPAAPAPAAAAAGEQGAKPPALGAAKVPGVGTPQGRVSALEGRLMLRGKDDQEYSYVERNAVVRERDSLWTDEGGRAEIELEKDSFVRLGSDTKLEIRRLPPDSDLRLWKGAVYVDLSKRLEQGLLVKTPAGDVDLDPDTVVRIDIGKADSARVSVYQGRATAFPTRGDRVRVAAGRRLFMDPGDAAEFPRAIERNEERDPLDQFEVKREEYFADRPLPKQLKEPLVGARELQDYGRWLTLEGLDYWLPSVGATWQPYRYGNWTYLNTTWNWNPFEPWGYATAHYGRWQYFPQVGWAWTPDYVWSPAWVYWGGTPGFISWCPLNPFNQPCVTGGALFATAGLQIDPGCWNALPAGDWGRRGGRIRPLAEQQRNLRPADFRVAMDPGIFPQTHRPDRQQRGFSVLDGTTQTAAERVRQLETGLRPARFVEDSVADRARRGRLEPAVGAGRPGSTPGAGGRPDPSARDDARERSTRTPPGAGSPGGAGGGTSILPHGGNRPSIIGGRRRDTPAAGGPANAVETPRTERGRSVRTLPAGGGTGGEAGGPPSTGVGAGERSRRPGATLPPLPADPAPAGNGTVRSMPSVLPRGGGDPGSSTPRATPEGGALSGRRPAGGAMLPDRSGSPIVRPLGPRSPVRTLPVPDAGESLQPGRSLTPGGVTVPGAGPGSLPPRGTRGVLPGDAGGSILQPGLRPGRLPGGDDSLRPGRLPGIGHDPLRPGVTPGLERPSLRSPGLRPGTGIEAPGLTPGGGLLRPGLGGDAGGLRPGSGPGGSLRDRTGSFTPGLPGAGIRGPDAGGLRAPGVTPGGGILPGGAPSLVPGTGFSPRGVR